MLFDGPYNSQAAPTNSSCLFVCFFFLKDSQITFDQYRALGFDGAVEIGNMFEFYKRGNPDRNIELTRKLNPGLQRFDVWVQENKEKLVQSFKSIEIQSS